MAPKRFTPFDLIVRLWREKSNARQSVWRGWVECVQTGERAYFQGLTDLLKKIVRLLGEEDR